MQVNVLFRDFQCSTFQLSSQPSTTHSSSSGTAATGIGKTCLLWWISAVPASFPWHCPLNPLLHHSHAATAGDLKHKLQREKLKTTNLLKTENMLGLKTLPMGNTGSGRTELPQNTGGHCNYIFLKKIPSCSCRPSILQAQSSTRGLGACGSCAVS